MATSFPELFNRLAEPFDPADIKILPKGKGMQYVTARTVMNRLDDVLGPENWEDVYIPGENSVMCRLTIELPSGKRITKCDAGGYAGMPDQGDDDKSGFSDAFKRAAVKFGVGRHLYRDGVVTHEAAPEPPPRPTKSNPHPNNSGHGHGIYASPEATATYRSWLEKQVGKVNDKWAERWVRGSEIVHDKDLLNPYQADGHLVKWAASTGRLDPSVVQDERHNQARQKFALAAVIFHRSEADAKALKAELAAYCQKVAADTTEKVYRERTDLAPPGYFEDLEEARRQAEEEAGEDALDEVLAGKGDAFEGALAK